MPDELARAIAGALKQTIDAHGPISQDGIPSATKRLSHALREALRHERDRILGTLEPTMNRDDVLDTFALIEAQIRNDRVAGKTLLAHTESLPKLLNGAVSVASTCFMMITDGDKEKALELLSSLREDQRRGFDEGPDKT